MATAIFDADSHVMETSDWLAGFAEPDVREQLGGLGFDGAGAGAKELMDRLPGVWASHRDQEIGADVIAGPKGWLAPGALDTDVRSRVLDALGIDAQLVFPTFAVEQFAFKPDLDVRYGGTRALNRAMTAFCAPDPRLKAVGSLPLADPERAETTLDEALATGSRPCGCPPRRPGDRSPAHLDFDGVWARLAEAGVPFVLHVGGGKLLPKAFHNNGQPRPKDWLGGGENLRAKDFPVLHHSPERFLACMAIDGVFERHERCAARPSSSAPLGAHPAAEPRPRPPVVRQARAAAAATSRCCRRSTSAARCASRRSRSRTPPGSSSSAGPSCSCSPPTTRTPRAVAAPSRSSAMH